MKRILYAFNMSDEAQSDKTESLTKLTSARDHPLFRFIIAGLLASVVTFVLLFLMRYLIMGYDRSATEAITRYFTLRTVVLSDEEIERTVRVERPGERPELPDLNSPEFEQESEMLPEQQVFDTPPLPSPQQHIEREIQLAPLEALPLSTRQKLQKIKQEILSGEDAS